MKLQKNKFEGSGFGLALLCGTLLLMAGCGGRDVCLLEQAKTIPVSGGNEKLYAERSSYWDDQGHTARSKSNRQMFTFVPPPGLTLYVNLENMGGVPMKRDTIRTTKYVFAETYLRTITKDTNLSIHIETSDRKKPPTDVEVYVRNVDSVYSQIRFEGMKK
ncbi:MAG: hypothetical protein ABI444_01170 [Candidatus Kapaibacterium sp.]